MGTNASNWRHRNKKLFLGLLALVFLIPGVTAGAFAVMGSITSNITVSAPFTLNAVTYATDYSLTGGVNPMLDSMTTIPCTQTGTNWACASNNLYVGDYTAYQGIITSADPNSLTPKVNFTALAGETILQFYSMITCSNYATAQGCSLTGSPSTTPLALTSGQGENLAIVVEANATLTTTALQIDIGR